MNVKKTLKKPNPRAKFLPHPGPGRPKGLANKFTTLKQSFLDAFRDTGGTQGLKTWIEENKRNRAMFYQMITKLFPQEVEQSGNIQVDGKMTIEVVHTK